MTAPSQMVESIEKAVLLARVAAIKAESWRLVAISGARLATCVELLYSFDRNYELRTLRVELPLEDPKIGSVSSVYFAAVLYENELHDLFGIVVEGMAVDFKGNFYKTAVKFPFGSTNAPVAQSTVTATPHAAVKPASTGTGNTAPKS